MRFLTQVSDSSELFSQRLSVEYDLLGKATYRERKES